MKHIFFNAKRFDITCERGGVNRIAPMPEWGAHIIKQTQGQLGLYPPNDVEFVMFLPEAHLLLAHAALADASPVKLGSQSVYRMDTSVGGNFGAFTTNRTANAVREMGCLYTIIGHCEERNDKAGILAEAGVTDTAAINRILNAQIKAAQAAGLSVLYCIGEKSEEQHEWQRVLGEQLDVGLEGVDKSTVVIGYEPLWSIGPGKTPADSEYLTKTTRFIKEKCNGTDVVYGGGLKKENAGMLAAIPEIDGGLIALTRFAGEIGFYPEEYLEIIAAYLGGAV